MVDQKWVGVKRCIGESSMGRDEVFRDPKSGKRCQMGCHVELRQSDQ
jgi:hypothetical protein